MARYPLSLVWLFVGCWYALLHPTTQASDMRFVEGLRERGLYRLAEVYCRDQIDSQELTDRELAETAIQLSLVHVAHALDSPPRERDRLWQQAEQALASYAEQSGTRNFSLLTSLQLSLNQLRRAEVERLELLDVGEGPPREGLRQLLRTTIGQLREVNDRIEIERRALALGRAGGDRPFTAQELDSLARHTMFALAQGLVLQGLTYPAGSADRDDALLQAIDSLKVLATDREADPLAWQARVELLEALAELRRSDEGLELLLYWKEQVPPEGQQAPLVAAHVRLLLAAGRIDKGDEVLSTTPWPRGSAPEVDFARLEVGIAQIRAGKADAASLQPLLDTIRTTYRPRWIRRAENLVGSTFAADSSSTTAAPLQHAAEHYYRAGQYAKAIATYDQAAERYRAEQNRDGGFAAERTAAAIALEGGQFQEAAARFRRLALGSLDRDDSAIAHREAILALAAAAQQAPPEKQQETINAYILACREHLSHWPQHLTGDEVRSWLGRILVDRGQWAAAIEVLGPLENDSPYAEEAMPQLARAYREQVVRATNEPTRRELVATATARLQGTIVDQERRWPSNWTDGQRKTALELARMQLSQGEGGAEYAHRLLTAARRMPPPPRVNGKERRFPCSPWPWCKWETPPRQSICFARPLATPRHSSR